MNKLVNPFVGEHTSDFIHPISQREGMHHSYPYSKVTVDFTYIVYHRRKRAAGVHTVCGGILGCQSDFDASFFNGISDCIDNAVL
jgi:hypothetical protein